MKYVYYYDTALGRLGIAEEDGALTDLFFAWEKNQPQATEEKETTLLREAARQIAEYLAGERREFDLPLKPQGTDFQQRDWQALLTIPYGETRSYGQIAAQLGNAKACRAVGLANNRNPIAIIIPCHRVVGADGKLVGYGGGLEIKEKLLKLEAAIARV